MFEGTSNDTNKTFDNKTTSLDNSKYIPTRQRQSKVKKLVPQVKQSKASKNPPSANISNIHSGNNTGRYEEKFTKELESFRSQEGRETMIGKYAQQFQAIAQRFLYSSSIVNSFSKAQTGRNASRGKDKEPSQSRDTSIRSNSQT